VFFVCLVIINTYEFIDYFQNGRHAFLFFLCTSMSLHNCTTITLYV